LRGFAARVVHLDALANTLQAQCGSREEKAARAGMD